MIYRFNFPLMLCMHFLFTSLLVWLCVCPGFSQSAELRREIERILKFEKPVNDNIVPGFLVGVIDADSTFRFAFGEQANIHDLYELGSVTKPVVAWLINEALKKIFKNYPPKVKK